MDVVSAGKEWYMILTTQISGDFGEIFGSSHYHRETHFGAKRWFDGLYIVGGR